jgi:hypothetical protein
MSTSPIEAVGPAALTLTQYQRRYEHRFFTGMALVITLTAFVGFAPSYYLRGFSSAPPLTTLVHLHGALATTWILLFLADGLRHRDRRGAQRRHSPRRPAAARIPRRTARHAPELRDPGGGGPLAATPSRHPQAPHAARHHRDDHPALARFRWFGPGGPPVAIGGTCLLVIACLVYDRATRGRIHPAFLWGGVLLMLSLPARFALTQSDGWLAVARWLTR